MACVNQQNKSFFYKYTTILLRITIIFLILGLFSATFAYGIEFVIDDYKDFSKSRSTISKDGKFFTTKGSSNISLHNWEVPYKIIGMIKWKDELTNFCSEYLLYYENNEPCVLIKKLVEANQNNFTEIEAYNKFGKKYGNIKLEDVLPDACFSISPNKRFFGLLNDSSVETYNSRSQIEKSYTLALQYPTPEIFQISNNGSIFIFGSRADQLYYCDMNSAELKAVGACGELGLSIYANAFENSPKKFIVLSENGEVLLVEEATTQKYKININAEVIGAYADDAYYYVVTSKTLSVYSIEDGNLQGEFDVKEYYTKKYGENPYEKPFVTYCEFESVYNTFFLKGSGTINRMFNVKIIR